MEFVKQHIIGGNCSQEEAKAMKRRELGMIGGTSWRKVKEVLVELIEKISYSFPADGKFNVLDLGCGRGLSAFALKQNFNCEFTGVDIYADGIADGTKKLYKDIYIDNLISYVDSVQLNKFDVILLIDVLEHIPQDIALEFLQKIFNKSKGWFVISTPNWRMPQHGKANNPLEKHVSWWDMKQIFQINPDIVYVGDRGEGIYAFNGYRDLKDWKPVFCTHKQKDVKNFLIENGIKPNSYRYDIT